jgi:hypothetical protein
MAEADAGMAQALDAYRAMPRTPEEFEQAYPMSDAYRAIPRTAEDFEREIDEYTASDAFAVDVAQAIATAEATPSPSDSYCDDLWRELYSEVLDNKTEFDEQCQAGFTTATQATDAANKYAGLRLTWSRKPPQSQMDMKVANRIPGGGQSYQRLVGCCPHAGSGCEFRVTFRLTEDLCGGNAAYKRDNSVACEHNHNVAGIAPMRVVQGYEMKERMDQLTPEERSDIMKHSRANLTPPSVLRDILFQSYKTMYSERLVLNAMRTAKAIFSRMLDGDTSMNKFYAELDDIREAGGRWKDSKRGDGSLKTVFIQTKTMRNFAEKYFKVVVVDATFGTNKHGLKLVPYVGIDALGKTQIMGIAYLPTENGAEIFEALDFFGLKNAGSTLITDDHSCYPKLAEEAGMNHLLCSYHFKEEILRACSVLPKEMRGRIAAELNAAIYEDDKFNDPGEIDLWFEKMRQEGCQHSKFTTFINRFESKQKKICGYWTRQFFNADSFASQRIEQLNNGIKGKGERKTALAHFNIYESYMRMKYTVANMEFKTKLELEGLASVSAEWAQWITIKWNANQEIWFGIQNSLGHIEPVTSGDIVVFNFIGHTVTLPQIALNSSVHPECSCNEYISSHLPCPFVVGACQMHYSNWKKVEYLHPRWRLADHPWHAQQICAQQLSNQVPTDHSLHNLDNAGDEADQYQELYKTAFRATTVPNRHWFGTELRQHVERIITAVRCEDDFKTATATLTVLQHKLERVGAGVARTPHLINVAIKANTAAKVGTNIQDGTKSSVSTKGMQPKRQRVEQDDSSEVGTNLPPKKSTKKKQKENENADGKQNDAYIRASIRTNGGLQNGLVVEVEPDEISKTQKHRWYMTITDGRLKNGLNGAHASVLAKFMQTNSKTVIEGLGVAVTCKVDSILSVERSVQFFQQASIRQEAWRDSRLMFEVRFQNDGACVDKWMDATVIEEALMINWLRRHSRSGRKLTEHEFATYPYECYFQTPSMLSTTSNLKCTEGKYKGKTFQEIFDKDVSYCILMLELFAESKSKIRAITPGGVGQFCR